MRLTRCLGVHSNAGSSRLTGAPTWSDPGGAGHTKARGLTRSLDNTKEGLMPHSTIFDATPTTGVTSILRSSEVWAPTPYDDYEVSSLGNVKRVSTGRVLKPFRSGRTGHLKVDLRGHRKAVHQLVAAAFIGPRPPGTEVCHNDNNPANNAVENLRYDTRSANVLDLRAIRTHCPHGHEYTEANSYINPLGWRSCRECKKRYR